MGDREHLLRAIQRTRAGKDVYWYTREKQPQDSLNEEFKLVKQREEELMMEVGRSNNGQKGAFCLGRRGERVVSSERGGDGSGSRNVARGHSRVGTSQAARTREKRRVSAAQIPCPHLHTACRLWA